MRYFLKILQLNNYDENKREEIGSISSSLRDERNFLYIIFTIRKFHTTMKLTIILNSPILFVLSISTKILNISIFELYR